jgi:surface antigen
MFQKFLSAVLVSSLMLLSACESSGPNKDFFSKENIGSAVGAIGGAWIGSNVGKGKGQIVAIAAGTLLGAGLGKELGATLDRGDLAYYEKVSQNSLENTPTDQTTSWVNPDTGASGAITPVRTFQGGGGQYCREYQQTITIDGKTENGYGTACRQSDGSWKIVQ